MSVEEFWRSTPRITNLVIEGYLRRRAWAAFHSGYGMQSKNARIEHLLGRPVKPRQRDTDSMLAAFDRFAARHNARIAQTAND